MELVNQRGGAWSSRNTTALGDGTPSESSARSRFATRRAAPASGCATRERLMREAKSRSHRRRRGTAGHTIVGPPRPRGGYGPPPEEREHWVSIRLAYAPAGRRLGHRRSRNSCSNGLEARGDGDGRPEAPP